MQYYIKRIRSVSDYFAREDNEDNREVEINIVATDEKEKAAPKHLIITGINGTGKTVLLTGINKVLREHFVEVTNYPIEIPKIETVATELIYSDDNSKDKIKYFEPLFITADDMFMPTRRENFSDYVGFFLNIAAVSDYFLAELENRLKSEYLYGAAFEKLSVDKVRVKAEDKDEYNEETRVRIKLKNGSPFDTVNMASGHYSFLNIYCHMRFTQLAFYWEDKRIWIYLHDALSECEELSKNLADRIKAYRSSHVGTNSRALDSALETEETRTSALRKAYNIAQSRYEVITGTGKSKARSRARDRDIALYVSQALHITLNDAYNQALINADSSLVRDADILAERLKPCADMLFGRREIDKIEQSEKGKGKDYPLIILIDEPESHLHISLQKKIIPFFVECFPNAQFIVATHSPFVITSLPDATLFNMENRQSLDADLTLYSYENIVEGWFGISLCNDNTKRKYAEFKSLAESDEKLTGESHKHYAELYALLIKTDFISSVMRLNLRKELKDDEIYVPYQER